jgi:hypothetical protein
VTSNGLWHVRMRLTALLKFLSVLPRINIFVDASLSGLGGVLGNYVYELAIVHKPNYCIAHWEAINILLALLFSPFLASRNVTV